MKILESIETFLGRLFVVTLWYLVYRLVGFEVTVVVLLAGIFVNTNPDFLKQ